MVYVNLMRVQDVFLMIWLLETWLLEARCPRAMLVADFPGRLWPFLANWGWNGVKPDPMTVSSILPSRSVLKDLQSVEYPIPKHMAWAKRCMEKDNVSKTLPDEKKALGFD